MPYSKQIVYLSDAQYQELVTEGSITVSGTTITYNANNIYVTPQTDPAELVAEKYEDLTFPVAKGQHCIHNGGYYEANQAISTSESWTAAHWTDLTNIGAEASQLKSAINGKQDAPETTGTAGQVLSLDNNLDPVWTTPSGGGGTVDDTLSDSSTNPVQNKVITGEINVIEELQTQAQTGYLTPFVQGSVSQNTGVIDTTATDRCYIGKLPMKAGDKFTFSRAVNTITTSCTLAIYNESGTYLSGRSVATGTTITFENDGMFAISCQLNSNVTPTMQQAIDSANASFSATFDKTKKIVATVNGNTSNIVNIENDINKMRGLKFTQSDMKTGVYYKITSGVVSQQTESSAKYLPMLDVSDFRGMKMHVWTNARRSGSSRSFGFCDAQGNVGNYYGETNLGQVSDGGYYKVVVIDKDYMFFSCSSDPTTIRIEISGSNSFVDRDRLDWTLNNGKYYHMSFDDVYLCLQDITTNASTYESVFENEFLGWCKSMHDQYGTTFSLYVFYANAETNPTWTLQDVTNAFASEFTANSDWLKFSLHAYSSGTTATSREATASTDYANAINELVRITGSVNCIDRMPRLHEYNGTLTALTAMRDCNLGPVGFIASADTDLTTPRDSYYFDADENAYMYTHCYMYDSENFLHFVKTSYLWGASNSVSIPDRENSALYYNRNRYVEVFTHENSLTSGIKSFLEGTFNVLSYSHRPYFMMDLVLTN